MFIPDAVVKCVNRKAQEEAVHAFTEGNASDQSLALTNCIRHNLAEAACRGQTERAQAYASWRLYHSAEW